MDEKNNQYILKRFHFSYPLDNQAGAYWKKMYARRRAVCAGCRRHVMQNTDMCRMRPLPYVGPAYQESRHRILIVGKAAWGSEKALGAHDTAYSPCSEDALKMSIYGICYDRHRPGNLHRYRTSPFWTWLLKIAYELEMGKKWEGLSSNSVERYRAFQHVCYSTLVKCDVCHGGTEFSGNRDIVNHCVGNAGWIFDEIRVLKPKNVIFFPGHCHEHLTDVLLGNDGSRVINDRKMKHADFGKCKNNNKLFRHLDWNGTRILVCNSPQGAKTSGTLNPLDRIIEIIREDDREEMGHWELPVGVKNLSDSPV